MFIHKVFIRAQWQLNILLQGLSTVSQILKDEARMEEMNVASCFKFHFHYAWKGCLAASHRAVTFWLLFLFDSFLLMGNLLPKIIFNSLLGFVLMFSQNSLNENPFKSLHNCMRIKYKDCICKKKSNKKRWKLQETKTYAFIQGWSYILFLYIHLSFMI